MNLKFQISDFRFQKLLLIACCLTLLASCAAEKAFKKGAKTAASGDLDAAVLHYQKAMSLEPDNLEYRVELEKAKTAAALKHYSNGEDYLKRNNYDAAEIEFQISLLMDPTFRKAEYAVGQVRKLKDSDGYYKKGVGLLEAKKTSEARTAFKKAISLNPKNDAAKDALEKIKEAKTKLDGYELSLKSTKPITLKFKDTSIKEVFEIISKLSGINFIFDEDLKDQKISIFLQDATFEQAMELLLLTNKLFAKAASESTVIIIPKTPAKMKQYQDLVIHTFYLSHIEAKKAVNLLRALLQLKQIHVNEELNALIVRDEPERIKLAQKIIEANDIPDAEVMMEVEIIEVSRDKLSDLGLNLTPSSISAGITKDQSAMASSMTYGELKKGLTDANLLFTPLPQIVFNFKKTQGGAKTLANPKIRVINNGKAKIHIGDRIPVITSTFTNNVQQTNIQYQDVGVKLNVEPNIHIEQDVTIKLSLEVSSIGSPLTDPNTKLVVAYQIGTRSAETVLNLRDGETQVIGGLIRDDERSTKVVIPLLGEIPILGRLFSSNSEQKNKTDILLAITPHVLRSIEIPSEDVTTIWSGKEDDFTVRPPFESFREKDDAISALSQQPEGAGLREMPPSPGTPQIPGRPPVPTKDVGTPLPESKPSGQEGTAATLPGKGTVYMTAPREIKTGQEFTVGIALGGVTNLYGASINLSYDPELIEFVRVSEGEFLKEDGKPTSFMHAINAAEGLLTVGMTRLGGAGGVNGAGGLFSAVFKAKGDGAASLAFQEATLKDPTMATLPSAATGIEVKIIK